ncbi:phage tail protein [Streptomyces sp. NPDC048182]|uniref:phage tail protein n=1 Tax=Streptomyces sp. NPDC048182 TaxID=3365507 RepID=UPI003710FEEC
MSRAAVPGLPSRHPIGGQLPALYADDDFAQRFTGGLDTVLAPVFATLDNLPAYFDPRLAPPDFVAWLASWVGAADDPERPLERRREAVVRALELHRRRGTRRGLLDALALAFGLDAEIAGDGAATWSRTAGADLPPAGRDTVAVRVWPAGQAPEDRVRALVRTMCPVHVECRVEFLPAPPTERG